MVADNFDCLLRSRSKSIAHGPIASSVPNVGSAEGFLSQNVLYPVDKILSVVKTTPDGKFDGSWMPWDERPSAGLQYYYLHCRHWLYGDVPDSNTQEENGRPIMVHRMRRLIGGGPWSYVFWDRERLVQVGVVSA